MKRCYNYANCTHKWVQGVFISILVFIRIFFIYVNQVCQHSVYPRTVFLKVRIIWGRGVFLIKTQIPALPPTETENLGKSTGKVYFLLAFQVTLMKNILRTTLPRDRKKLSLSTEEKERSARWWQGWFVASLRPSRLGFCPRWEVPLMTPLLCVQLSLRHCLGMDPATLHSNPMK